MNSIPTISAPFIKDKLYFFLALVSAFLGALATLGWVLETPSLIQIVQGWAPMQFNNALCFLLTGAAALLISKNRLITSILAGTSVAIAGLTLIQYIFNITIGIDQLLLETQNIIETEFPGRMAPNSALSHLFAAVAILFIANESPERNKIASILGAFVMVSGWVASISYLGGSDTILNWGFMTQMALNTSIGFVFIGIAIVLRSFRFKENYSFLALLPYIFLAEVGLLIMEIDLPQNAATGSLHVMVVILAWFGNRKRTLFLVAAISSAVVLIDILVTTSSLSLMDAILNRTLVIVSIWVAAVALAYVKSKNARLVAVQQNLEEQNQKLEEAEIKFKGIFDNTFQFIGLILTDGTLIEANQTALNFGGFTMEQARGLKFWEAPWWSLSEETVEQLKEAISTAATGEFVRYDVDVVGGDGSIITIDFSLRPIFSENGDVLYLVPEGRNIQERKELENKLQDSQELLLQFVKNTPNAVAMFNKNLEYIVASDAWYTSYGIVGKDIIGVHHYDVFPEIKEMPEWQQDHQRALAGEVIRSEKDRFEREDGSVSWLRYVIQPWKNEGEIGGIIMFTEDITERIELANKLSKSEKEFRTIFETIDEGIVYQNKDGSITNANAAAERILGISLDQMTGRKSIDPRWKALREDGSDFPGEEHPAMIAIKTGNEQRNIIQGIFHPEKEDYVWITANSYPIKDEETGEVLQVYSTFEDITDEYQAKKALLASEKRFNLAVQGTTAGLWDWISVKDDKQWWSPRFNQLLGYEPNELEPKVETFSSLVHPDDEALTFKLLDRHFKSKAPFVIEYRLKHKSGAYRWFLGSGQATWDENGEPVRMVGTIVDIHARKMGEIAEAKFSRELAEKNKELEEFTYVASHDLQEPVRTIASFVNLFKDIYHGKLDDQANEFLDLMEGASLRSQKLISDLLEYSRIGRQQEVVDIDTKELMNDILKDLSLVIEETKGDIKIGNIPTIKGHNTDIRLLFQNLITNAIKFTKPGAEPKIEVSSIEHDDTYEFIVSDNGIGIDPKFHDRIFVVFKRLHGRSEYEGTGIGLAHCKKVVDLHHGKIWVESEVDKGSSFHFTLPKNPELATELENNPVEPI